MKERAPGLAPQSKERGPNGRPLCRGCQAEVPKGLRAWCSVACREDTMVRAGWHVRWYVERRDNGVCAKCRADAGLAERIIYRLLTCRDGFGNPYFPSEREALGADQEEAAEANR